MERGKKRGLEGRCSGNMSHEPERIEYLRGKEKRALTRILRGREALGGGGLRIKRERGPVT